jgi:parallel beta-helix repeat protein
LLFSICLLLPVVLVSSTVAQNTIHVPADQPTIQAGINAASNGDTVLVAPGTYYENIDFKGKAITVSSSGGAASTIIDGGGKGPVVHFLSGELRGSVLNGLTLQHGGGGTGINGGSDGQYTAGILIQNAAPTIINNTIQQNNCYGIYSATSSPLIQSNRISGTVPAAGFWCDAVAIGAGIVIDGALGEQAEQLGGYNSMGPYIPSLFPTIVGNDIFNNNDSEDASSSGGGGIHVLFGYTIIQNNAIHNNSSQQTGGGIAVSNYNFTYYDTVVIAQNIIYDNSSACGGAGIAFNQSTVASIGSPFYITVNNTIVDNVATGTCKDGITSNNSQVYLWQDSDRFVFVNNIVLGDSATQPAVFCETLRQQTPSFHLAIFDHNDIFNSTGPAIGGRCSNPVGSYGNISSDPLFVSRAANDYRLIANSPATDAGNNSAQFLPSLDFNGTARRQDASALGYPVVDMGAYEFAGQTDANSTTVTLTPSAYQLSIGQPLTLTAALFSASGAPDGVVTFLEDGISCGSSVLNAGATAAVVLTSLTPGVHAFIATYQGQGVFTPAVSVKLFVVVGSIETTLSVSSSLNPAPLGQSVTFTVTSQASDNSVPAPITLLDGTTQLAQLTPSTSGSATYTTSTLAVGSHSISAQYSGDSTHAPATASLTQSITNIPLPDTLTLTCPASPIPPYQPVSLAAQITSTSGMPAGSVAVTLNNLPYAGMTLSNGGGTASGQGLPSGIVQFNAVYTSTNDYASSVASCSATVSPLPTTSVLNVNSTAAIVGSPITLAVSVSPTSLPGPSTPTGTVTFYDGTTAIDALPLDASGHANLTTATLSVGVHTLTAVFAGNSTYAASTSAAVLETINPLPQDFTITLANPNVTIRSQHHTTTIVTLTSVNGFADSLAISCANVPQYLTCRPTPASFSLSANGSTAVSLYLDTDSVLGYARNIDGPRPSRVPAPITWALVFAPVTLLRCARSRRHRKAGFRLLMFLLAILPLSLALAGCGELIISADIPPSVAPGTYMIPITATGAASGVSHTAQLTLQVAP